MNWKYSLWLFDVYQSSWGQNQFILICGPDADALIAGAPGAPMDVKCHDANRDYVIVTWKPPNTTSESPVIGYFVDKYVNISIYLILLIARNMYILKRKKYHYILSMCVFFGYIFTDTCHWNSVTHCVKLRDCSLANFWPRWFSTFTGSSGHSLGIGRGWRPFQVIFAGRHILSYT